MKNLFKKINCIFAIVLFFSSFGFSQPLPKYKIYGKVTAEGEPLVGASIKILGQDEGSTSDANGDYEISVSTSGNYIILIDYTDQPYSKEVVITRDTKLDIDVVRKIDLDAISVFSTRATKTTPMTFTNVTKEELEENNLGQDVPFLLKWTPSVVVTSDAGAGIGYTGIRVRGSDPSRINVTINGIPLNDSESQGTFWVDLPDFASSTEDIQIQRGVGTSTNGAGAFGASINLNTSKVKKEAYGQISSSIGSFQTRKNNVQFGSGLIKNRFTFDGRLSKINSNGYVDRAESDLTSYYLSAAFINKNTSLRFNTFSGHEKTYQAWNGLPAQFLEGADLTYDTTGIFLNNEDLNRYNPSGGEKSGVPHDNEVDDYTQTHYQALINHQINWALNFSGALHYTKGKGFFEQYKGGEDFADYGLANVEIGNDTLTSTDLVRRRWLDNDFYGVTYSLNYSPAAFDLTIGGGWNRYDGKHFGEIIWAQYASDGVLGHRYYDNDASKTDFNIYGKITKEFFSSLYAYVDLQYRRVGYEFLGLDADGKFLEQNASLSFFNPKVGLTYQFGGNQFYTSFAVANREPNRSDYTESSPLSRPKHETLHDIELGYRRTFQKATIQANAYWMNYKNQLVLTGQLNDVGEYTRTNVDESYRLGLELEGGIEIIEGLNFSATANFSQNKIKEFTEYVDNWDYWYQDFSLPEEEWEPLQFDSVHQNTDLAFSPNVVFSSSLSYDFFNKKKNKQLVLSLSEKFVGSQFIDNTSNENTKLAAYNYTDVRLGFSIKTKKLKEIGITLLVKNVLNNNYSANAWTYRYRSAGYDGRADDPYTQLEGGAIYNLTGFYPQAGRNYLLGLNVKF